MELRTESVIEKRAHDHAVMIVEKTDLPDAVLADTAAAGAELVRIYERAYADELQRLSRLAARLEMTAGAFTLVEFLLALCCLVLLLTALVVCHYKASARVDSTEPSVTRNAAGEVVALNGTNAAKLLKQYRQQHPKP